MSESGVVLVTGASGALGPAVVNHMGRQGYRVHGLGLAAPADGVFTAPVKWFIGDICDPQVLNAALDGVSRVVHLAALLHINQPPPELAAEYERVNVGGTQAVVDAALQHGVERLAFVSTIAVYGYGRGETLTEASETRPRTLYARTKLEAERIVLAARRGDGPALGVVLRLAAVYGSRVKGNYSRLVTALAKGRFIPVGPGDNRRTLVQERDVAAAVACVLEADAAAGQVYNVTDGEVHRLRDVIAAICVALERPAPRVLLPAGPIRVAASAADWVGEALGRSLPLGSAMLDKYLEDVAVDGGHIMRELNFAPTYDLHAGWREAVDGMRQSGALSRDR